MPTPQQFTSEQTIQQIISLDAKLTANTENSERIGERTVGLIRDLRQRLAKYTESNIQRKIQKCFIANSDSLKDPLSETLYDNSILDLEYSGQSALNREEIRFSSKNNKSELKDFLNKTKMKLDLIERQNLRYELEIEGDKLKARVLIEIENAKKPNTLLRESKVTILNDARLLQNLGYYVFMPTSITANMKMNELENIRDSIVFSDIEYRD